MPKNLELYINNSSIYSLDHIIINAPADLEIYIFGPDPLLTGLFDRTALKHHRYIMCLALLLGN